jgi:hypothetical protein
MKLKMQNTRAAKAVGAAEDAKEKVKEEAKEEVILTA